MPPCTSTHAHFGTQTNKACHSGTSPPKWQTGPIGMTTLRRLRPGGNHTLTGHWEPSGNVAAQMGKGPSCTQCTNQAAGGAPPGAAERKTGSQLRPADSRVVEVGRSQPPVLHHCCTECNPAVRRVNQARSCLTIGPRLRLAGLAGPTPLLLLPLLMVVLPQFSPPSRPPPPIFPALAADWPD